jgi:hypothetical protein
MIPILRNTARHDVVDSLTTTEASRTPMTNAYQAKQSLNSQSTIPRGLQAAAV